MIEIKDLRKSYKTGYFVNKALDGVNISFRDNEFVAVLGPSGSGKTTLLNVLGGLDRADSGDIVINGVSTKDYKASDWDTYRNHRIGFIFQSYNLIPHQTVLANVELALTLANVGRSERTRRAKAMLEKVGLADHVNKRPNQLSGGQMQRVAIARALVNDPDILLADEPTGALDVETGIQVMDLLSEVARDRLVIMVTHNPDLAHQYATRIIDFSDGKVVGDSRPITPEELRAASMTGAAGAGARPGFAAARTAAAAAGVAGAHAASASAAEAAQAASAGAGAHAAGAASGAHAAGAASGSAFGAHAAGEGSGFAAREHRQKTKKASMSFLTALSLSFNNLMTKKGRTFLTAFAGSIGIIGIAAILALSNGVNAYIADVEEEALTAYPLTITKSSFDLTNLLTGMAGYVETDEDVSSDESLIPQSSIMTDMFAKVKNNDLKSFKEFLDNGGDGIWDYVNDIEYDYGITPLVYKADTSDGVVQLNPSYMSNVFSNGLNSSSLLSSGSGMESFQQMLEDQGLIESQMEVVEGRWPESYDEGVLVLSKSGKISDYTLYSLGVLDTDKMEDMTKQALNGEEVTVPDDHVDFSYDDALNMTFKVVPSVDLYQHNDDQDTWTDMSNDKSYMKEKIAEGVDLKIVGVVKPREDATSTLMTEGVGYTPELTEYLMETAADSEIVKEQREDRDTDVFTGKTFEELQDDEEGSDFDFSEIFSVDEDALSKAFSFDTSAFESMGDMDLDLSDLSGGDDATSSAAGSMDASALSSAFDEDTMKKIMQGAPQFSLGDDALADSLTEEEQQQLESDANTIAAGYIAWLADEHPEDLAKMMTGEDYDAEASFSSYVTDIQENPEKNSEAAQALASMTGMVSGTLQQQISKAVSNYMVNQFAPYLSQQMQAIMTQAAQAMATQLAMQMAEETKSLSTRLGEAISGQLSSQMKSISSALQDGFSVDADAFANAIQFNMTQEDLTSLLTNYMNADELTYDGNLSKLGYASADNPESISIYSKDFPAKEQVLSIIDGYNEKVSADGDDSESIQYSDIAGALMSSVTDIADTISLVLIAFVSISLVVSSIMIAIVTYISVLERKKEIGVLRAMGASRGNIASVFNAETIIEGFIAGVLAIAAVLLASIPVNQIIWDTQQVPNAMQLPWDAALGLIGISVLLTFIAGLIPSQKAAHADPVEALRSE